MVGTYTSGGLDAREIEEYAYDYSGHRVGVVHSIDADANMTPESWTTRTMLVDTQNFTGSPQVLEETLYDDSATPVIIERQAYLNALTIAAQTTTQYTSGVPDICRHSGRNLL